jgi:hypothetical protein
VYIPPRSRARLHARKTEPAALIQVAQELELNRSVVSGKGRSATDRGYLHDLKDAPRKPSYLVPTDPLPEDLEILLARCSSNAYKACKRAGETEGRHTPSPRAD